MNKQDLRILMLAAFRYSLGRRTYMPSYIVDLIIKNQKIFNDHDWKQFIEEITSAKKFDNLGDGCDIQTWDNFINFCEGKNEKIWKT